MVSLYEKAVIHVQWLNKLLKRPITLYTIHSDEIKLATDANDRRLYPVVPYLAGGKVFNVDDYLGIALECESQDGIDYSDCDPIRVPITIKDQAGIKHPVFVDKTGSYTWLDHVDDGTIFDVEEEKLFCWFRCALPFVVGHKNQFNSRINVKPMDDTL